MKNLFSLLHSIILLVVSTTAGFAQPVSQTFNTSGTYTVPAGYSALVTIEAWGAGGGGGSGAAERGGGGGGAYATITATLTPGSYSVVVGTGGVAGTVGTASTFSNLVPVVILSAGGGGSTTTATGGSAGVVVTGTGFTGGGGGNAATTGGAKGGGGGGGSATSIAAGGTGGNGTANPTNLGGAGGAGQGPGGKGANGGGAPDAVAGTAPGGGGSGRASGGGTSKTGAAGRVIITVNTLLPVKLSNIKAYEKLNGIQIDWTAYSEENLNKYQVERSANGSVFNPVGEVAATNSVVETRYGFFDPNSLPGVSYYRLKNIDIDGRVGFSNIVKVNLDKNVKGISLYPNPVTTGYVSFQSSDLARGNYSVKVFNAGGQQVYSQRFTHTGGAVNQTLHLPGGINPGLYSIQLENDIRKVMNKTFTVQ
jgi:hypothetical protein